MSLNMPHRSKREIIAEAAEFYSRHNRVKGKIYLIEEVIEQDLRIDISLEPDLQSKYDVEAFTTGDFTRIIIDENSSWWNYGRYRFMLAHEVGHYVLHREILKTVGINTVNAWIAFHRSLSNADYKTMEQQSNLFASHLLMPETELNPILEAKHEQTKEIIESMRGLGMSEDRVRNNVQDILAKEISGVFEVSVRAAEVRIKDNSRVLRMFARYSR